MAAVLGADANSGLDPVRLAANGRKFVFRYLSDDEWAAGRNITPLEASMWQQNRFKVGLCWENAKTEEVWGGFKSGERCAQVARLQAQEVGLGGAPIYFAVDKWTSRNGLWPIAPVREFFKGVRSVIGLDRAGVYGTLYTVENLQDLCNYFWQTKLFRPTDPLHESVHVLQYLNADLTGGDHFGAENTGSYCCYDRAFKAEYGARVPSL